MPPPNEAFHFWLLKVRTKERQKVKMKCDDSF